MFDPHDLEALIAVADHGGIAAAARALSCTQPAVSRRVQRLERQAGTELVRRRPDGSTLLPKGQHLAARARHVLRAMADLQRPVAARGPVVGVLASVEGWLLPTVLQRLSAASSEALLPASLGSANGMQAVAEGRLDAAIVSEWRPDDRPDGVAVLDLLLEPYVLLFPLDHRLLQAGTLDAGALRGRSVVSAPHPDCGGRLAESGRSQRMAASLVHAQGLVARGDGIAVWPGCTTSTSAVARRGVSDHRMARRLAVAVRSESLRSPAMRRIVEAVAEAFRERPGGRGRFLWRGIAAPPVR